MLAPDPAIELTVFPLMTNCNGTLPSPVVFHLTFDGGTISFDFLPIVRIKTKSLNRRF